MYTVSDAVEMGSAHELILVTIKCEFVSDDFEPYTLPYDESLDE